jgi:hypothetical protein
MFLRLRNLQCEAAKVLTRTAEPLMTMIMYITLDGQNYHARKSKCTQRRVSYKLHISDYTLQSFLCKISNSVNLSSITSEYNNVALFFELKYMKHVP